MRSDRPGAAADDTGDRMAHHEVLIVGGGNAGISLAARLLRDGARDVAVVESEAVHRYRPLLNYVGAGEATMASLERPAASVMPPGCTWVQDRVVEVDPDGPSVRTRSGARIGCTTLVVCPGLDEDWDATPGLVEASAAGWAGSTFVVEGARRVWPALRDLTGGRVVFTVPPEPAPCSATALKPLFMACDHWRRRGVLTDIDVHLVLPGPSPLGLPEPDRYLEDALASYGVDVLREARVTALGDRRVSVSTPGGPRELEDVTFAHVVPHYRAPSWVAREPAGRCDAGRSGRRRPLHAAAPAVPRGLVARRRGRPRHPLVRRRPAQAGRRCWPATSP